MRTAAGTHSDGSIALQPYLAAGCPFSHQEFDLLSLLRDGATDEQLAERWQDAMWVKPKAHDMDHADLGAPDFVQPDRSMSAIPYRAGSLLIRGWDRFAEAVFLLLGITEIARVGWTALNPHSQG